MALATGLTLYEMTAGGSVVARGVLFPDAELDEALSNRVTGILWDDSGRAEVRALLAGVATTGFREDRLREVLDRMPVLEDWRIGEALAEAYLVDHRACEFPWPAGRDQKNPQSSAAGTDLVGFQHSAEGTRFAFGEVKTSEEESWPPRLIRGRHGLSQQLANLRDSQSLKDQLMLYLGHHAVSASWSSTYQQAAARYLDNPDDVSLFGFLVRDVRPDEADLSGQAKGLGAGCPPRLSIELQALFLPKGTIPKLVRRAQMARVGVPT